MDERFAELEARLTELENQFKDKVDGQLIGGLKKAKDTYDDNIAFDDFKGKYGEQIGKIDAGMKRASANPNHDTVRDFYDAIKTVVGLKDGSLDVATMIADKIQELAYRYNIPLEVSVADEEVTAETEEPTEEKEEKEVEEKEKCDKEEGCDKETSDKETSDKEEEKDPESELPSDEKLDEIAKSVGL